MGLLSALGLTALAQAPKQPGAGKALKDADFPTDAKRRKLADEEARRRGQERLDEKPEPAGKGPQAGPLQKKIDKAVDKAIDDAGKKVRQLNKDTMPEFELFEELSPEAEFAEDLKKGIENAKQQIEFIQKTIAYAEKFGDKTALKPLSEAAKNLNKISEGVLSGLSKAGKAAALGKDVVVFFQAMKGFADASNAMSAGDGQSVEAWVGSLQRLWNAGKPFVDRLKDEAFTAALAGSEAAGALGATLAIVGAQLFIGIKALEAGVKVVNAYFKRLHEATKENSDRVVARPDPPQPPLPFSTRQETIASLKKHDAEKKQLDVLREKNKKETERLMSLEEAQQTFETSVFPKLYRAQWRALIMGKVEGAWRSSRGTNGNVREWWNCFVDARQATDEDPPEPNDEEIPEPPARKLGISAGEAADEVQRFLLVSPRCNYFDVIYEGERKKYLAKAVAPG